ncbi:hypothetical protein ACIOHS_34965 [Streptomyces sp. NPDC088253]
MQKSSMARLCTPQESGQDRQSAVGADMRDTSRHNRAHPFTFCAAKTIRR